MTAVPTAVWFEPVQDDRIELFGLIIVSHGPPHGYGDLTRGAHVGSTAMTEMLERVRPRLVVCGHIDPAYGHYRLGVTEIINASLVDEDYCPVNPIAKLVV